MKRIIDIDKPTFDDIIATNSITGHLGRVDWCIRNSKPYEERPTGHWIDTGVVDELGHVAFECSICHKSDEREETEKNVPFCKYCGADMRKGSVE